MVWFDFEKTGYHRSTVTGEQCSLWLPCEILFSAGYTKENIPANFKNKFGGEWTAVPKTPLILIPSLSA